MPPLHHPAFITTSLAPVLLTHKRPALRSARSRFFTPPLSPALAARIFLGTHLLTTTAATPTRLRARCPPRMSSSQSNPFLRPIAALLIVGLIATSFAPLAGVLRNAGSPSANPSATSVDAKLRRVPVFAVTDDDGRPFLVEADDHLSRVGYFFVDPADAAVYLARVADEQPGVSARILPVGLDEALRFVSRRPARSAVTPSAPEAFVLVPSAHEADVAARATDQQFRARFGRDAIPLFYVEGLAFAADTPRGSSEVGRPETVYPVFFEKEKLDKTLEALREKDPGARSGLGEVEVTELLQTVRELRVGSSNAQLERVVFVPMDAAVTALGKEIEGKQ